MNRFIIFLLIIAAGFLSGCASGKKTAKFQMFENQYSKAVAKSARTAKLYSKLETALIVDAIHVDDWLRKKWVEQQARTRRLGDDEKSALLAGQMKKHENKVEFALAIYTSEDKWNDLAMENSRLTVMLISGEGATQKPATIKKVDINNLIILDHLPFEGRFRTFYMVTFPRDKVGAWPYNLSISSPAGDVKLTWEKR